MRLHDETGPLCPWWPGHPAALTSRWKAGTDRFYRVNGRLARVQAGDVIRCYPGDHVAFVDAPGLDLDRFEHDA